MTKSQDPAIEAYHAGYQAGFENGKRDAVRHGEWERGKEVERAYIGGVCVGIVYDGFTCSSCGYKIDRDCQKVTWSYCPFCGCAMDGKENEDE